MVDALSSIIWILGAALGTSILTTLAVLVLLERSLRRGADAEVRLARQPLWPDRRVVIDSARDVARSGRPVVVVFGMEPARSTAAFAASAPERGEPRLLLPPFLEEGGWKPVRRSGRVPRKWGEIAPQVRRTVDRALKLLPERALRVLFKFPNVFIQLAQVLW